jgi:hypothetical protein
MIYDDFHHSLSKIVIINVEHGIRRLMNLFQKLEIHQVQIEDNFEMMNMLRGQSGVIYQKCGEWCNY